MPGGLGKGSSPAGTTTTLTQNPTQTAQLPFLTGSAIDATGLPGAVGWNQALNLAIGNPYQYYPGQSLATPNYWLPTGYNELAASGANAQTLLPYGNSIFTNAAGGGTSIYNSPAFSGLSDIASGTNAYLQQSAGNVGALSGVANASATSPYSWMLANLSNEIGTSGNPAIDALTKTSSGAYLNSNPYVDEMYGAASDAVTRAYQTATAPQTAANFTSAGRYGSGAYANAASQNEQNLVSGLGNLSANIYGGNYQAERARQDAASQALGALIAQNYGLETGALNLAGQQYLQGQRQAGEGYAMGGQLDLANLAAQQAALTQMQSGYQTGNQQQLTALQLFPSLLQAGYSPSQAMIQAGLGMTGMEQSVIDDAMKRFYGTISAPWQTNQAYLNQIGQPTTGSGSVEQPYFTNPTANVLGGLTGGLGLYNGLRNAFGGASSVPSGWLAGSGAGSGIFTNAATGVTSDIAGSGFPGLGLMGGLGSFFSKLSDRRLKKDAEFLGRLPNGLPVYRFHYLWDDGPQIGLMADEVERVHPEAVVEGPFGFRMVDYARALQ